MLERLYPGMRVLVQRPSEDHRSFYRWRGGTFNPANNTVQRISTRSRKNRPLVAIEGKAHAFDESWLTPVYARKCSACNCIKKHSQDCPSKIAPLIRTIRGQTAPAYVPIDPHFWD